jgi:hypothetical protein
LFRTDLFRISPENVGEKLTLEKSAIEEEISSKQNVIKSSTGTESGLKPTNLVEDTTVSGLAGTDKVTNGFVFYDVHLSGYISFSYKKDRSTVVYNIAKTTRPCVAYQSALPLPIFMFICAIEAPSGSRLSSLFSAVKVANSSQQDTWSRNRVRQLF